MAEQGKTARPIEIHASFRFAVAINKVNVAAFTECTLPNLEVETLEIKEGGLNQYSHKLPVRVKVGSVTLRHGLTHDARLLRWYLLVLEGDLKKAMADVSVVMYNGQFREVATWNFQQAYPVKWKGPTLKTDQQALAIEELELAFHGFSVDKGDDDKGDLP